MEPPVAPKKAMSGVLSTIAGAGSSVLLRGLGVLENRKDLGRGRRYLLLEDMRLMALLIVALRQPRLLYWVDWVDGVDGLHSGALSIVLEHSSFYTRRHHGDAVMSLPSSDTTVSIIGRIYRIYRRGRFANTDFFRSDFSGRGFLR